MDRTQPNSTPTEFQKLIGSAWVTSDEKNWIATLLEKKSVANEAQSISLDRLRVHSIQSELERYKSAADLLAPPMKSDIGKLDEFFREWIERK